MASTNFISRITKITAEWLNEVNAAVFDKTPLTASVFDSMTDAEKADVSSNTGALDVTAVLQTAVNRLLASGGVGTLELEPGTYLLDGVAGADSLLNGILFPWDGSFANRPYIRLLGKGNVYFKAGSDDLVLVRVSRPFVEVSGITFLKNGRTGVIGVGVIPEDTTQTTTQVSQSYFLSERCGGDVAVGYAFQPGPQVAAKDSGSFYHTIRLANFNGADRVFDFRKNVDWDTHFNHTTRVVLDHPTAVNSNCVLYCDAVGDLTVVSPDFELTTAAGTLATATAIHVTANGTSAKDIRFIGGYFEANTRDIYTDSTRAMTLVGTVYTTAAGAGASNIIRLDRDMLQLSYDVAGANVRLQALSSGGWRLSGDTGAAVAGTLGYFNTDGVDHMALTPYLRASDGAVDVSGNFHELSSDVSSAPSVRMKNRHASAPTGMQVQFSDATPNNTTQYAIAFTDSTSTKFIVYSDGSTLNTTGVMGTVSDASLKNGITDAPSTWNKFKAYQWRHYYLNGQPENGKLLGLIAQEAREVSPGVVDEVDELLTAEDGTLQPSGRKLLTIKSSVVTMQAHVALQEAMQRIEALEGVVAELRART